jgi:hypothetical protein
MTDAKQALRDDISFMRALAEEGRATPMLGGSILLAAGLIFGTGQLFAVALAAAAGPAGLPAWAQAGPAVATAAFLVMLVFLRRVIARKPGAHSPINRATGAAWRGIGVAILVLVGAFMITAWRLQDWRILAVFPAAIFGLYGAGWLVSSVMTGIGWLKWVSYASFALMLGASALADNYLVMGAVYGVGLFLLVALPGYLLMRQAPSDIV